MNVLAAMPEPEQLKKLMRILASLNVVLCPEEWLRYHSFVPGWAENVSMAKIDNGSGDHLFILFSPQGTLLKGFDHESELSPHARDEYERVPGIYEGTPNALISLLENDGIESEEVTFCIWRECSDSAWQKGKAENSEGIDDGSDFLLGAIYRTPEDFVEFAKGYFEITPALEIVAKIFEEAAITAEMIPLLNPGRDAEEALQELESLGLLR